MSKKQKSFRGIWFVLIGVIVGLGLGFLTAGPLTGGSLLGSSNKRQAGNVSFDTAAFTLQMEKTEALDQEIRKLMEEMQNKLEKKENTQQDMIRLQNLMSKRNQAFDMMSNMMAKDNEVKDTIMKNMD